MSSQLRILVLVDPHAVSSLSGVSEDPHWIASDSMESQIYRALGEAGHRVRAAAVKEISSGPVEADLIFNLTSHLHGDGREAMQTAAFLDVLEIPYTGSGPQAILRACDRHLCKHLAQVRSIQTPRFWSISSEDDWQPGEFKFPLTVLSRFGAAREGLEAGSPDQLRECVSWIHRTYHQPAHCEEIVEGREIAVCVLGNERPVLLPFWENSPSRPEPKVDSLPANSQDGDHDSTTHSPSPRLPGEVTEKLKTASLALFREFGLRDYGILTFRLTSAGNLVFIAADHRPDCSRNSILFQAFAQCVSPSYKVLAETIGALALRRSGRPARALATSLQVLEGFSGQSKAKNARQKRVVVHPGK